MQCTDGNSWTQRQLDAQLNEVDEEEEAGEDGEVAVTPPDEYAFTGMHTIWCEHNDAGMYHAYRVTGCVSLLLLCACKLLLVCVDSPKLWGVAKRCPARHPEQS